MTTCSNLQQSLCRTISPRTALTQASGLAEPQDFLLARRESAAAISGAFYRSGLRSGVLKCGAYQAGLVSTYRQRNKPSSSRCHAETLESAASIAHLGMILNARAHANPVLSPGRCRSATHNCAQLPGNVSEEHSNRLRCLDDVGKTTHRYLCSWGILALGGRGDRCYLDNRDKEASRPISTGSRILPVKSDRRSELFIIVTTCGTFRSGAPPYRRSRVNGSPSLRDLCLN